MNATAARAANIVLEDERRERAASAASIVGRALGPGCLKPKRSPIMAAGIIPCHVVSYANGALLTGGYYAHPRAAMSAYSDDGPWYPIDTGWRSMDSRTLIELEDGGWSEDVQRAVDEFVAPEWW